MSSLSHYGPSKSIVLPGTIPIAPLGVEPVLRSKNGLTREWWDADLYFDDQYVPVRLLVAPQIEIATESLGYMIGQVTNAPVLPSFIAIVKREYLIDSGLWRTGETEKLAFAYFSKSPMSLATTSAFDPKFLIEWAGLPSLCVLDLLIGFSNRGVGDFRYDGQNLYAVNQYRADFIATAQPEHDLLPLESIHLPILEKLVATWSQVQRRNFLSQAREVCAKLDGINFRRLAGLARIEAILGADRAEVVSANLQQRVNGIYPQLCNQVGLPALHAVSPK